MPLDTMELMNDDRLVIVSLKEEEKFVCDDVFVCKYVCVCE